MKTPKIVFLDRDTLPPNTTLKSLSFDHEFVAYPRTTADKVSERIADADFVITNKVRLDATALAQAPNLKLIAVAATGYDIIDTEACGRLGISVCNVRAYGASSVSEHAFSLIFSLRRNILAYRDAVRQGRWLDSDQFCFFDYPINDLRGSRLAIIGRGVLGMATADIGRALGMEVVFSARKDETREIDGAIPFDELLRTADIISLHCPLTAETKNLIGAPEFAKMHRRPLIINTARGGLVNEPALVEALRSGQISGAGFDVTTIEPMPANHPFVEILGIPNFILTPHIAWASTQSTQTLADQLIDNIELFAKGQPRNIVG
ncbi:alanine dehydrogenase/PNT, C-terminal domain protein [Collimonas arenae]|uniref:Alanine dehydrogenase/PNT, C-terminal domain protein n=1 Tax=Collimonas arenae TaxID=279058 RepID=A0A127PKK8_9BURK|nr:D-2-hydroxyacid dehydrogenase [Collimonas arenae]AMO98339.1 alanine dehydrogenase/PNT, C-terminal domain protein [Collimonas arenae]AMP08217.1 alanine dehydrogenase/PNT, C-terminal domain protein [Collimonas arenae]